MQIGADPASPALNLPLVWDVAKSLWTKVKATSAVEVIPGTHPYKPENIFA
jgi:hypothetical protein